MTLWQAVRLYPKAISWSIFLSTALVMEGYDVVLMQSFYAFPAFAKRYGQKTPSGEYQITAAWQSGLSNGANVGEILGLFINGIVSKQYGYRFTMIASLTALTCFIFIPFFASNIQTLEVGEILMGIPWGVFQTLTTAYASEFCPVVLRGYLTTYANVCWGIGQLIAAGVLRGLLSRSDQWAYRIPFALQWMWPVPLIIGISFAPESPWWLVRKDRIDDARKALLRLTSQHLDILNSGFDVDQTIAMMVHTDALDRRLTSGTSYCDCFRGIDLRRTEIVCVTWAIQNLCGAAFMGYSSYFFQQAGLSVSYSFDTSMALYAVAIIGVFASWFFMTHCGRRTLYLGGLVSMFIILLVIGLVAIGNTSSNGAWVIGSLLLAYTLLYDITVGTVAFSIVAEIPSSRLRTKTIVLGRNSYNIIGIINGVITPYMLSPSAWNWKGKAGFFWAGSCFLCLTWTYFRLPEPKGRTFEELDLRFEKKISARKFRKTAINHEQ
ncbi:maltose permease, putative [Talaromyces stipitatus ATCC 10500]|uniref:Maltose permease, putative n=1 Tax=Talaromyces stipitatus (strain ATCC 10500 / CBS 375.48 / QM 6759 / NRRL 1006) TaxID=441959 RepID=B8MPH6_TALSN|nr:maltose permease, putative [Talaromyces stipitatus ATCC 10500]EED14415.1 maltose permease, putative [Talaromyces stipitatus ATCC 10500]